MIPSSKDPISVVSVSTADVVGATGNFPFPSHFEMRTPLSAKLDSQNCCEHTGWPLLSGPYKIFRPVTRGMTPCVHLLMHADLSYMEDSGS